MDSTPILKRRNLQKGEAITTPTPGNGRAAIRNFERFHTEEGVAVTDGKATRKAGLIDEPKKVHLDVEPTDVKGGATTLVPTNIYEYTHSLPVRGSVTNGHNLIGPSSTSEGTRRISDRNSISNDIHPSVTVIHTDLTKNGAIIAPDYYVSPGVTKGLPPETERVVKEIGTCLRSRHEALDRDGKDKVRELATENVEPTCYVSKDDSGTTVGTTGTYV